MASALEIAYDSARATRWASPDVLRPLLLAARGQGRAVRPHRRVAPGRPRRAARGRSVQGGVRDVRGGSGTSSRSSRRVRKVPSRGAPAGTLRFAPVPTSPLGTSRPFIVRTRVGSDGACGPACGGPAPTLLRTVRLLLAVTTAGPGQHRPLCLGHGLSTRNRCVGTAAGQGSDPEHGSRGI